MNAISNDNSTSLSSTWFLDPSASHHLTSSVDQVPNATPYVGSESIVVSNGNTLSISSVRSGLLHVSNS